MAKKIVTTFETDRRGAELKTGTTVAFNHSGEIDIGEIVRVSYSTKLKRYNGTTYTYLMQYEVQSHTRPTAAPSKIKRKENLLAVENY